VVIVLIGIAEIKSVEDGTECGIGARVERRCGKEISNFRFEISDKSEERNLETGNIENRGI